MFLVRSLTAGYLDPSNISGTSEIYRTNEANEVNEVNEVNETNETKIQTTLKCDSSREQPIILVPQPSQDPNDPLVCFEDLSPAKS